MNDTDLQVELPVEKDSELLEQQIELLNQLIQIEIDRDEKVKAEEEALLLQQEEELKLQQEEEKLVTDSETQFRTDILQALADLQGTNEQNFEELILQQDQQIEALENQLSYYDSLGGYVYYGLIIVIVAGCIYPSIWIVKQLSQVISSAFQMRW